MNVKQNKILSIYIFKIFVFIYLFIRLLIIIGEYIFILKKFILMHYFILK